jgi:hypothetical protein
MERMGAEAAKGAQDSAGEGGIFGVLGDGLCVFGVKAVLTVLWPGQLRAWSGLGWPMVTVILGSCAVAGGVAAGGQRSAGAISTLALLCGLTCDSVCPRVTVRDRSSPGLMARRPSLALRLKIKVLTESRCEAVPLSLSLGLRITSLSHRY